MNIDAKIDFPGMGNSWKASIGPLPGGSGSGQSTRSQTSPSSNSSGSSGSDDDNNAALRGASLQNGLVAGVAGALLGWAVL